MKQMNDYMTFRLGSRFDIEWIQYPEKKVLEGYILTKKLTVITHVNIFCSCGKSGVLELNASSYQSIKRIFPFKSYISRIKNCIRYIIILLNCHRETKPERQIIRDNIHNTYVVKRWKMILKYNLNFNVLAISFNLSFFFKIKKNVVNSIRFCCIFTKHCK